MSALPRPDSLYRPSQRATETEALQEIGKIANAAACSLEGLHEIAEAALRVPGVRRIEVADGILHTRLGALAWPATPGRPNGPSELAAVEANGRLWGYLRLIIGPEQTRFATFLGQQVALLFNRVDLIRRRDALRSQAKRLSERLETRKRLHRAGGLVARARGISDRAALQLLIGHARKSRRSLNRVAEAVLLGYETPLARRPGLRRLEPQEPTGKFHLKKT